MASFDRDLPRVDMVSIVYENRADRTNVCEQIMSDGVCDRDGVGVCSMHRWTEKEERSVIMLGVCSGVIGFVPLKQK